MNAETELKRIKELITFMIDEKGKMVINNIKSDVHGTVAGNISGDVIGNIGRDVWGTVEGKVRNK